MSVDDKKDAIVTFISTYMLGWSFKGVDPNAPKGDAGAVPRAFVEYKGEESDAIFSTVGATAFATSLRVGFRTGEDAPGNSLDMAENLKTLLSSIGLDAYIIKDMRIRAPAGRELCYGLDIKLV